MRASTLVETERLYEFGAELSSAVATAVPHAVHKVEEWLKGKTTRVASNRH